MNEQLSGNQRRVRHIQGIHLKNLTPFPVRDHVSSTLQQPHAPILQLSDDTDILFARRRIRRMSQNSAVLRAAHTETYEDDLTEKSLASEMSRAPRTKPHGPLVNMPHAGPSCSPSGRLNPQRSASRTTIGSHMSGTHSRDASRDAIPTSAATIAGSSLHYPSQRNLEKVMSSRLVETFVTLSTPESMTSSPVQTNGISSTKTPPSPIGDHSPVRGSPTRRFPPSNKLNSPRHSYHRSEPSSLRPSNVFGGHASDEKQSDGTTRIPASAPKSRRPTANDTPRPLSASLAKPTSLPQAQSAQSVSPTRSIPTEEPSVPFFISSLHRPSTNPCWTDLDPSADFARWTDRHQSQVAVTLWGKVDKCSASAWSSLKGKDKEADPDDDSEGEWVVLMEWNIQMDKLEKVEADLLNHPSRFPPNTLLLSLAPSGDLYSLAPGISSHLASETNYASDSELSSTPHQSRLSMRSEALQQSRREVRMKQSATWADIVELSTLRTVVRDTEASLDEVVHRTDAIITQTSPRLLARDISEREERLRVIQQDIFAVKRGCASAAKNIQDRMNQLRVRREALQNASEIYDEDVETNEEQIEQIHIARATYTSTHNTLIPRRTILCNGLESIFPIEPNAERAAELVFTIIGVPLAVPVAPSDPAPPLDNEETVSAALGYAAHVVALLSAYLNVRVPYPVTYVGSRSYVRDPISAMHGPRMFPLYPTGVDTYRFEYAVFLLNKDIETLMAEQGLRAIDLRHTLPNLKNLILTLTTHDLTRSISPVVQTAPVSLAAVTNEDMIPTPRAASPVTESTERAPAPTPAPARSNFLSPLSVFLWSKSSAAALPKVVTDVASTSDSEGLTPTAAGAQLTPRPDEAAASTSDARTNPSTNKTEGSVGEPKAVPTLDANGVEKLQTKISAETTPSSPFSHTIS